MLSFLSISLSSDNGSIEDEDEESEQPGVLITESNGDSWTDKMGY